MIDNARAAQLKTESQFYVNKSRELREKMIRDWLSLDVSKMRAIEREIAECDKKANAAKAKLERMGL